MKRYHEVGDLTDIYNAAKDLISRAGTAADVAKDILGDPAFPQVTSLVKRLSAAQPPIDPRKPKGPKQPGIGLRKLVTPLKIYVATVEKPWLKWAILGAAIGIPVLIGYRLGKRHK